MSKSARLHLADLRTLYELTNECRDLGDDPIAWRQHFLAWIGTRTDAGVATILEVKLGTHEWLGSSHWGWETSGLDRAAWDRVAEAVARDGLFINPMMGRYMEALAKEDGIALSRADLIPDAAFYRSEYYRKYHRPTGADAQMSCIRMLPAHKSVMSALALVRPTGVGDFRPRDRALVREAHALIATLVGGALAHFGQPSPSALPARVRQVLLCLLEGDGDKQIAMRLKLSVHTVNEYAKRVFVHFGVVSRTELLARWVRRGWGASGPAWTAAT